MSNVFTPTYGAAPPGFADNWGVSPVSTAPASTGYAGLPSLSAPMSFAAAGNTQTPQASGMPALDIAQGVMQGVQTIANIWSAYQANKLAKKQFEFTKEVTNTNLNNQIKSYNTALSDRANARGHTQGNTAAEIAAYITANQVKRG